MIDILSFDEVDPSYRSRSAVEVHILFITKGNRRELKCLKYLYNCFYCVVSCAVRGVASSQQLSEGWQRARSTPPTPTAYDSGIGVQLITHTDIANSPTPTSSVMITAKNIKNTNYELVMPS